MKFNKRIIGYTIAIAMNMSSAAGFETPPRVRPKIFALSPELRSAGASASTGLPSTDRRMPTPMTPPRRAFPRVLSPQTWNGRPTDPSYGSPVPTRLTDPTTPPGAPKKGESIDVYAEPMKEQVKALIKRYGFGNPVVGAGTQLGFNDLRELMELACIATARLVEIQGNMRNENRVISPLNNSVFWGYQNGKGLMPANKLDELVPEIQHLIAVFLEDSEEIFKQQSEANLGILKLGTLNTAELVKKTHLIMAIMKMMKGFGQEGEKAAFLVIYPEMLSSILNGLIKSLSELGLFNKAKAAFAGQGRPGQSAAQKPEETQEEYHQRRWQEILRSRETKMDLERRIAVLRKKLAAGNLKDAEKQKLIQGIGKDLERLKALEEVKLVQEGGLLHRFLVEVPVFHG